MTVNTSLPRARDPESNSENILTDLAERASTKYALSSMAWLECAHIMLEARAIAKHGQWLPFLKAAGIPQRTAARMIDFARAHVQISHMANLSMNEIDATIAYARHVTALGVEHAKADPHRMAYQLTSDEIQAGEWDLANAMVEYAVEPKEQVDER